jgi:hypothetical protein
MLLLCHSSLPLAATSSSGPCCFNHESDIALKTDGATPLFITVKKGHTAIVAQLIAVRSNIDLPTTTSGATPIFTLSCCKIEFVQLW